jgi:hypothetical protein
MQFYAMQANIVKPKNIYLSIDDVNIDDFKTLMNSQTHSLNSLTLTQSQTQSQTQSLTQSQTQSLTQSQSLNPRKILAKAYKYSINCTGLVGLFTKGSSAFTKGSSAFTKGSSAFTKGNQGTNKDIVLADCYHLNWLYYASFSPYWLSAIASYGGVQDHVNRKICYDNSSKEEDFYEIYWLDPDEQTLDVQYKSIQPIEKVNVRDFYLDNKYKQHNVVNICTEYLDDFVTLSLL